MGGANAIAHAIAHATKTNHTPDWIRLRVIRCLPRQTVDLRAPGYGILQPGETRHDVSLFPPEALEANRRGELFDEQLRNVQALSRSNRKSQLSSAGFFIAGALLIGFSNSPTASVVVRALFTGICLASATFLVVRSVTGSDPLTRDLRSIHVQSVEGAIGKRRRSSRGARSTYFLDVGDSTFKVGPATYAEAPDAALVRVYFLPLSRKVVNLERLPNPPLPAETTVSGLAASFGTALLSGSRRRRNEVRAELESVGDAFKASVGPAPVAAPADGRDPRPLAEAVVGTWTNGLMKVTFSTDGTVTTNMLGVKRNGHWSVDGGRLHSDITGKPGTADAWVVGDNLTIAVEGDRLTFTRG